MGAGRKPLRAAPERRVAIGAPARAAQGAAEGRAAFPENSRARLAPRGAARVNSSPRSRPWGDACARFASTRRAGRRSCKIEEVDLRPAGQGRGPGSPSRDRGQFPRHLSSHRLLPDAPAADPGRRRRGRGRRGRRGRQGLQARRPGRLCRTARRLRRGAQHRRAASSSSCRAGSTLRHRGRDDAQGPHRAISAAPDLQGEGGRLRSSFMPRPAASGRSSASGAGRSARR